MVSPSLWVGKAVIGGSEHDIWEMDGEIWKVTRPDRFGWTVLPGEDGTPEIAEATPLEYLERWLNANRMLGDNAKLRGISEIDEGVQIVISHPFIEGPYPEKPDIIDELRRRGFMMVPRFFIGSESDSSFYNDDKRIGILTRPATISSSAKVYRCRWMWSSSQSVTCCEFNYLDESPAQATHPHTLRATRFAPQAAAGATSRPHAHLHFTTCSKISAAESGRSITNKNATE